MVQPNVDAIAVGNATLFLQRARRKIRELAFNFDVDGYVAPDMDNPLQNTLLKVV
jgi:hypothetical protein